MPGKKVVIKITSSHEFEVSKADLILHMVKEGFHKNSDELKAASTSAFIEQVKLLFQEGSNFSSDLIADFVSNISEEIADTEFMVTIKSSALSNSASPTSTREKYNERHSA